MKATIRLDLADVDGTLVTQEKELTHNARQVVAQLGQAGILFATTSGRPPRGMQTLIKDLNISTVVAGFNGGVFATPRLDPIVMRDLPRDATARVIELIRDHGLVAWLYTDTVWYQQLFEGYGQFLMSHAGSRRVRLKPVHGAEDLSFAPLDGPGGIRCRSMQFAACREPSTGIGL